MTRNTRRYLVPFDSGLLPQVFTDVVVIGAGVAGLRAAIAASEHSRVVLISKGALVDSTTMRAQGGIAAALGEMDCVEDHVRDTLRAGDGLCDEPVVRGIVSEAGRCVGQLQSIDSPFDVDRRGNLALGLEGAHTHPRIVHSCDSTGEHVVTSLLAQLRASDRVRVFERCFVIDAISRAGGRGAPVAGVLTAHPRFGLQIIRAGAVVLASGGAGAIFRETSNPACATGDGIAIAYRAGAALADMACVQFHPTALYAAGAPRFLISEAVRGEGATLVDRDGRPVMLGRHALGDLAPRDVVSRAIVGHIAEHGGSHVFLDARSIRDFNQRFPMISRLLAQHALDPAVDLIPVHPAAHYTVGGIVTDPHGRTGVPGLYAAGECASTGLHGANRLASNSLLEGLVMGERVGSATRQHAGVPADARLEVLSTGAAPDGRELDLCDLLLALRSVMWRQVGIIRTGSELADADERVGQWAGRLLDVTFDAPEGWEAQNMLMVARRTIESALWRRESRGCHWRSDHPTRDPRFQMHDDWTCWADGPSTRPAAHADAMLIERSALS